MFDLRITPAAERDLDKLKRQIGKDEFKRIVSSIDTLIEKPLPYGVRKIKGKEDVFRVRVGRYRVIYRINDKLRMLYIERVIRRNESAYNF
jgi:mRNA interferase RelE/StbE